MFVHLRLYLHIVMLIWIKDTYFYGNYTNSFCDRVEIRNNTYAKIEDLESLTSHLSIKMFVFSNIPSSHFLDKH